MHQCVLIVTGELLFSQNCYGRLFSVYNHSIHPTSLSPSLSHTLSIPPLSRSRRCSLSHSLSLSISGSLKPFTPFFYITILCNMYDSLTLSLFHSFLCYRHKPPFGVYYLSPFFSFNVSLS